ncbi:MAG: GspE/PulE family protein [Gammaproteobacteria bacterium]|nr:GspE/PulE family protein [Gammaproteobacteria bacterium]NND60018.1 type II/IV secretion system protein [Gammaproteobacteria bacterium]
MSDKPIRKRIRLGDLLIEEGVITQEQLQQALARQKQTGKKLGRSLTEVGAITEPELHGLLAKHLGIEYLELGSLQLDSAVVQLLPEAQARRFRALVLHKDHRGLLVGMADPTDLFAYDEIARAVGQSIRIALISESELLRTIDVIYRRTDEIAALAAEVDEQLAEGDVQIEKLLEDEQSADAPIIRLLQSMFGDAVRAKASDIHIEPDDGLLRIRLRVDGVLQEQTIEGRGVSGALVTRLKLMSGLDISEKRLPQDGRFSMRVEDHSIDVRVSTMPIQHGESVVLRLLDQSASQMQLAHLGMPAAIRERFEKLIRHTAGMVLVTGPTGSGKTTTLYSALNEINQPGVKVITAEDPVEYRLERINQVGVNSKIGLSFSTVLRTVLRQDPDIILVGEMRDEETVEIGLRAAMTGHLVFSTLHTISAAGAVHRLLDMGAPPYLVAAALHGILAQRLVRRVCEHCSEPVALSPHQRVWLEALVGLGQLGRDEFVMGSGCNYCHLTGYNGRIGVYELLELDQHMTETLRTNPLNFATVAKTSPSFRPLVHCALDYARSGITSLDEVIRVSGGLIDDAPGVSVGSEAALEQVAEPVS